MKALTLWRPWGSLMVHGHEGRFKDVENRKWYMEHRGDLVIHSGKVWDGAAPEWIWQVLSMKVLPEWAYQGEVLLGVVEVYACLPWSTEASQWHVSGQWGIYVRNPRAFVEPVPWRGAQGLWEVPDAVVREALAKRLGE